MAESRELVVIGAGPGGYEVALHAAKLGRRVTLIERRGVAGLGGECLHTGCIPSKAFIELADDQTLQRRATVGDAPTPTMKSFQSEKRRIIESLRGGLERMLTRAGVEVVSGVGRFIVGDRLIIENQAGPPTFFEYRTVVLATGSRPTPLKSVPFDGVSVLDSTAVLALEELPSSLAVIGGGYIGVELGTALAKLGVAVTIVEMADQLLPEVDSDLAATVAKDLTRLGVRVELQSMAVDIAHGEVCARRSMSDEEVRVPAEKVLVAIGRRANTDGLGLNVTNIRVDHQGLVETDEQCRASSRIYAIGDVRDGPALAHRASAEARLVAEVIAGVRGHRDVGEIPLVVFSDTEVASVGRCARDIDASNGELVAGKVSLAASGRAATLGHTEGFLRVVAERSSGAVVGVQAAAPHASELIAIALTAIELGAVLDDLDCLAFPHPTLSELLALAARIAQQERSRA